MEYMSSTGVGTLVPSRENNGAGVLTPLSNRMDGTEVPTPEKYANGAGVLTPSNGGETLVSSDNDNGTKVPAPEKNSNGTEVPAPKEKFV